MASVLGICNLHDSPKLGNLTEHRALGSVTFLGRYGLMDFTLSNFSNSGIDSVAILADRNIHSVRSHIGSGQIWINNTKTGFQRFFFNEARFSSEKFNTDVANILANKDQFEDITADYVIVAPAFFIMSFDFRELIKNHIANNADVTILYHHSKNAADKYLNCDSLNIGANGRVTAFSKVNSSTKNANVSLETYVFNRETFRKIVSMTPQISEVYQIRDMVRYCAEKSFISLHSFAFNGLVLPILNIQDYFKHSTYLFDFTNRQKLFKDEWPIYTTTHNTPPSLYGEKAKVTNSFVANGSVIKGKVINSIISRNVVVEEGAVVENSILFTNTVVGKKTHISYVVADKGAKICEKKELLGEKDSLIFVPKGAKI